MCSIDWSEKDDAVAVKVEKVPAEPIIIATLSGDLTPEIVQDMFAQSATLVDEIGGPVYRITDIRLTEISFHDLVLVLADCSHGQPGSPADPRIRGMLVGTTHEWSRFFADSLQQEQYGRLNIPIFEELDQAMAYIHEEMASASP
jgi:hypothetical protein